MSTNPFPTSGTFPPAAVKLLLIFLFNCKPAPEPEINLFLI